jgi:zinc protease
VNRVAKQYLVSQNSITATLTPVPSGQPVAEKGFGGAEQVTSAPTKPVQLPEWAASALAQLKVPANYITASDTILPNGIRLIVKTDATSPTVTVMGSIKHNSDLQTPPGQEGVSDLLEDLFSYGTQTLDRLAFRKALDDIAANESAGYSFSVKVLKDNFSRGVQLLADNELHPALPAQAFPIVKQQTVQFVAGNLITPEYRTSRALDLALLPPGDPVLREVTPATLAKIGLDQVKQYFVATFRPDLTTIVVIGDVSAKEAEAVVERWFGDWKAIGPKPNTILSPVPLNKPSASNVPDPEAVQDSVDLSQQLSLNRFDPDYYPLQLGNHVLGGGFYATRLYHDLRQVAGYVYNVDVSLSASETRASYSVTYGCDPQNVSKARALIQRDLDQMRTDEVPANELHQAKALLLRQIPLGESSEDAVAEGLLRRAEIGLPLDEPIRAAETYAKISAAEVKAAFAKKIRTGDFVQVVRGPAPQ